MAEIADRAMALNRAMVKIKGPNRGSKNSLIIAHLHTQHIWATDMIHVIVQKKKTRASHASLFRFQFGFKLHWLKLLVLDYNSLSF